MKQAIRYPNLALRFALELCMLAALGIWGYHAAQNLAARLALAIGAPLIAAIVWGMFVAPRARISVPTWLWVMLQVALFGCAAAGLAASGYGTLALILAAAVVLNSLLLYLTRE